MDKNQPSNSYDCCCIMFNRVEVRVGLSEGNITERYAVVKLLNDVYFLSFVGIKLGTELLIFLYSLLELFLSSLCLGCRSSIFVYLIDLSILHLISLLHVDRILINLLVSNILILFL